jgi:hypothetical protein
MVRPANGTSGGNASIAQGILGFGVPSGAGAPEPCVGTNTPGFCYGTPSGMLVVPTDLLVPPGTAGLFYLSIETAGFSGTADTKFGLFESGAEVLNLTVSGTPVAPYSKVVVSQTGAIPVGTYTGPATLTARTIVTPDDGGTPVTLTANTQFYIVPPPAGVGEIPGATAGAAPRLVQGFVGFQLYIPSPGPCAGGGAVTCYGLPAGVVALPLDLIVPAGLGGAFYYVLQTGPVSGSDSTLLQLVEDGKVAWHWTASAPILSNRISIVGEDSLIPPGPFAGSATIIATTSITPGNGQPPIRTVKSGITMQIIQ